MLVKNNHLTMKNSMYTGDQYIQIYNKSVFFQEQENVRVGVPCTACNGTGTVGTPTITSVGIGVCYKAVEL